MTRQDVSQEMVEAIAENFTARNTFDPALYERYDVKRGLRNADGTGVMAGLTRVSNVHGYLLNEGDKVPTEGKLTFRGYDVSKLIESMVADDRFGFEEICYLLLMGELPTPEQLSVFRKAIDEQRELPDGFTAEHIMRPPTKNVMNLLQRSVSLLYTFDEDDPEDLSAFHEVMTAVSLLSRLPRIMVLGYYAKKAFFDGGSMIMHRYIPGQTTAETILSMLRPSREFTHEEAVMLDIMMMLHAEHGGGNNSTFACRLLTSANTDPYSAYSAAIGSLKGSRHGGANIKVSEMFNDIKANVANWHDEGQVADYLVKIVNREAFDGAGLIYGMGHAVYTLSDPRAETCRFHAKRMAAGTEFEEEFELLDSITRLAPEIINAKAHFKKSICPNVDMFSGLVYKMLGIPEEIFTPLFVCSRMAGWAAHRFEELVSGKRIMRPAYKSVIEPR